MATEQHLNSNNNRKSRRVYLTFNEKQLALIDNLVGEVGNDRADVVKTTFLTWLSEKGITPALLKKRMKLT